MRRGDLLASTAALSELSVHFWTPNRNLSKGIRRRSAKIVDMCPLFGDSVRQVRKPVKDGKLIYHLTALENWESIARSGLLSRNLVRERSLSFTDIARPELIEFRGKTQLNDYVPFHFFCKNPFDGDVQRNRPDGRFLYIAVHRATARARGYRIIPRHPRNLPDPTKLLHSYDEGMEAIDWDLLERRDYQDEACKQVCMAECLARDNVPLSDFYCLFAPCEDTASPLRGHAPRNLSVIVNSAMFVWNPS